MRRRRFARPSAMATGLWLAAGMGPIGSAQEVPHQPPPPSAVKPADPDTLLDRAEAFIKPLPLESIPDSPPPHEGAMLGLPHRVEPPDLILIDVVEALPGRPIQGERLVRPNGKVSLGFYGEIHVAGLDDGPDQDQGTGRIRDDLLSIGPSG